MALDYNTLAAALNLKLEDKIESQINRATVLTSILRTKPSNGQKSVAWDVRFGTQVGAAISDGANVPGYNLDTKVEATLPYCTYSDAFQVFGRAAAAAAQAGPMALQNLYEEEAMNSAERLAAGINADLYLGTGGTSPEVIMGLVATAGGLMDTGTYASISRSTYTQWAGNVLGNSGTGRDLSIQLMRDTRKAIYEASGKKPDVIVCDPSQHERYGLLIGQFRRYINEVTISGRKITLDGGYGMLEFDGVPIIEDKDCPAGQLLFLNTNYVNLWHLPDVMESMLGYTAGERDVMGTDEEQMGDPAVKLRARVQPLAVNGDVRNLQLLTYLQLQVSRPNACGVLTDLNP